VILESPPMDLRDVVALIENLPELAWVDQAACGGFELDQLDHYFVDVGHTVSAETIATCRTCPVRGDCLDHAYLNDLTSGYFGGLSPSQRRRMSHAEARASITGASLAR
jgi:hypothetical protein